MTEHLLHVNCMACYDLYYFYIEKQKGRVAEWLKYRASEVRLGFDSHYNLVEVPSMLSLSYRH